MFSNYHKKYKNILKSINGRNNSAKFNEKSKEFKNQSNKTLFDISTCKCKLFSECNCVRERKVLKREQTFLADQRSSIKVTIGRVDTTVLKKIM